METDSLSDTCHSARLFIRQFDRKYPVNGFLINWLIVGICFFTIKKCLNKAYFVKNQYFMDIPIL